MPCWRRMLLVAFLLMRTAGGRAQHCALPRDSRLESSGDVTIGALLNLRQPGDGILDCGPISRAGLEVMAGLRWIVDLLNKPSALIPGVSFGLKVLDSCGHAETSLHHLSEFFPVPKGEFCSPFNDTGALMSPLGVLDMTGILEDSKVAEKVQKLSLPAIPLKLARAIPSVYLAKIILEVIHDFEWERIALLHAEDEYSIQVVKTLGEISMPKKLCIQTLGSLPSDADPAVYKRILSSVTVPLLNKTAVIIVGDGSPITNLLNVLVEEPDTLLRLQWFFSWIPEIEELAKFGRHLNARTLFSLAPLPYQIKDFEAFWTRMTSKLSAETLEDHWFLQYVMTSQKCRMPDVVDSSLPLCLGDLPEDPAHVLRRTSRVIPVIHTVLTLAHAYKKAWRDLCHGEPGLCEALKTMNRREFLEKYLDPLEFQHDPLLSLSPPEVSGRKSKNTGLGEIEEMKLSLASYSYNETTGVHFKQIISYDDKKAEVIDPNFEYVTALCNPEGLCSACIKVRQARKQQELGLTDSGIAVLGHPGDLYVPILAPLHHPGPDPLQCGAKINQEALQGVEAALWAIDQINANPSLLQGAHLSPVILDSCSSPLRITQHLATLIFHNDLEQSTFDFRYIVAAISLGPPEETRAAAQIFLPLNITVLSAEQVNAGAQLGRFLLQIPPAPRVIAESITSTLKSFGWDYVSVLLSRDEQSLEEFEAFEAQAQKDDICLALTYKIDDIENTSKKAIDALIKTKQQGSRVIVLFCNDNDLTSFFNDIKGALDEGLVRREDFIWIGNGDWGKKLESIKGFEAEALGAIVFRGQLGEIPEFSTYFRQLNPRNNQRNPWFQEFWQQEVHCESCSVPPLLRSPLSAAAVQAVWSMASGLGQLRNEACPREKGICHRLLQQPHLRELINGAIQRSGTPRPDLRDHTFTFAERGFGKIPIEIFNLQQVPGSGFAYQKVGVYDDDHLKISVGLVAYDSRGQQVPLETRTSTCSGGGCGHCDPRTSVAHASLPSPHRIFVVGVFPVHERNPDSAFGCGKLNDIKSVEAFLWALETVNSDPTLHIQLGGIALDSCSSRDKAYRDLANLLSKDRFVTGIVFQHAGPEIDAVLGLSSSLAIPTLLPSPLVSSQPLKDHTSVVSLSLSSEEVGKALLQTLQRFQWKHISLLASPSNKEAARLFKERAEISDIKIALYEVFSADQAFDTTALVARLIKKQKNGAKVLVTLLSSPDLDRLLSSMEHSKNPRDLVVVHAGDDLAPFMRHPVPGLGSIVLHRASLDVYHFEHYFQQLDVRNNSRNPWFREFWEKSHPCQGEACGNQASSGVSGTIQGIFLLARALEDLRRSICPPLGPPLCHNLREHPHFSHMLLEAIKNDAQAEHVSDLIISNYRRIGSMETTFVPMGSYNPFRGLVLNLTQPRTYDQNGRELPLSSVRTFCSGPDCKDVSTKHSIPSFVEIGQDAPFTVAAFLPVHRPSESGVFRCGNLSDPWAFHQLAAMSFALAYLQQNGSNVGGLVLDYCGRREKALDQLYSIFSDEEDNPLKKRLNTKSSSIVSVLTFTEEVEKELSPLLQDLKVSHIAHAPIPVSRVGNPESLTFYASSSAIKHLESIIGFVKSYRWDYAYIVHSDDEFGTRTAREFENLARASDLCIAKSFAIANYSPPTEKLINNLLNNLVDDQVRVIIVITDNAYKVRRIFQAAQLANVLRNYVWVLYQTWDDSKPVMSVLRDVPLDVFSVKAAGKEMAEFKNYLSRLRPDNHAPFPREWFEEFWQHHFRCQLRGSAVLQSQYSDLCSGSEQFGAEHFVQASFAHQTIRSLLAVSEGLNRYLERHCKFGPKTIDECGENARVDLANEVKSALECKDCKNALDYESGYQVYQWKFSRGESYLPKVIGIWDNEWLYLENSSQVNFVLGKSPISTCVYDCQRCSGLVLPEEAQLRADEPMFEHFKTIWGITTSSLSVLGIFLVLVCTLYFLMAFPISVGTTILGYMILFGLMALYAVNFAFILSPNETVCAVRRFALGLAYSVIFSGMLVKVLNTWRLMGYNGNRMLSDGSRLSTPSGLLVLACSLVAVQVIFATGWLILDPPEDVGDTLGILQKRCNSSAAVAISMSYSALLAAATVLLAGLTLRCQDNNRESRWILACCALATVSWLSWGLAVTRLPLAHPNGDFAVVAANLACATAVMLCLYLRKLYLYTKLTRLARRDREMKMRLQPSPNPTSLYGTLHDNLSPVLFGSQATLNNKKIFGSRSKIREEDARSDSSGSVQVQATDLYPLDMYDGGSQFQPYKHRMTGDDTLPFAR